MSLRPPEATGASCLDNIAPPEIRIVTRPNDRVIRSALVILGLVWWCNQAVTFMRQAPRTMSYVVAPLSISVAALGMFLVVWLSAGADVFVLCGGVLRHERRIGLLRVWRAGIYPLAAIKDLRVEERVYKIKGNTSRRFEVVFDDGSARRCLVWRRSREASDDLVRRLHDAMKRA